MVKFKIEKKEFHKSKKPIDLNLIDINKIVISDRFEVDEGDKYYIGYKGGEFVRPLCIILPQMSGFIKYFDGNRKNIFKEKWRNNYQIKKKLGKNN